MATRPKDVPGHRWKWTEVQIDGRTRDALVGFAELDPTSDTAQRMVADVEDAVSLAVRRRHALEDGPTLRASSNTLARVAKSADELAAALRDLGDAAMWELFWNVDTNLLPSPDDEERDELPEDLAEIAAAATKVAALRRAASRRGRRHSDANDQLIADLARIFDEHATGGKRLTDRRDDFIAAGRVAAGMLKNEEAGLETRVRAWKKKRVDGDDAKTTVGRYKQRRKIPRDVRSRR